MASSTARRLMTGSEPGRPRQTGQMLVFGASPKALRHPQNSLVAVDSSQWTSRPTTVSYSVTASPVPRHVRAAQPASRLAATRIIWTSPRAGARTCTPTGSPSALGAEGHADGRVAGEVGRDGAHVAQVHGRSGRPVLAPNGKATDGVVGVKQHVEVLVGRLEGPDDRACGPFAPGRSRRRSSRPRARRSRA